MDSASVIKLLKKTSRAGSKKLCFQTHVPIHCFLPVMNSDCLLIGLPARWLYGAQNMTGPGTGIASFLKAMAWDTVLDYASGEHLDLHGQAGIIKISLLFTLVVRKS